MPDWNAIAAISAVTAVLFTGIGGGFKLYQFKRQKSDKTDPETLFEEKGFEWLIEKSMSYDDLLKRLIAIDVTSIGHFDYGDSAEGTARQWSPVFEYSKDTWRLIIYRDLTIAAYWQAVSLTDSAVSRLRKGTLRDSRISIRDVRPLSDPGDHSIYVIFIGRHPDFAARYGNVLFRLLMHSLKSFVSYLDEKKVAIRDVYANGQSAEGEHLCKFVGMRSIIKLSQGGELYWSDYASLDWRWIDRF